jgi:RNA polymerase sigma factor (sigma-70 family)
MGRSRRTSREGERARIRPFQVFLEQNREIVYRFLVASAGPVEADDLFQETFLAALRAYPRLSHDANLRSWVLTIATRKVIDAARAAKRRPTAVPDVAAIEHDPAHSQHGLLAATEQEGMPFDPKDPLWRAVMGLSAKQRAAVVHRFVLDRSYREVGAALGCSAEAARANVSEGVRKLRERMNRVHAIR